MPTVRVSKQNQPALPDTNFWMITFSDLIMLLLTFFVLLLTMKSLNQKDVREIFPNASLEGGPLDYSRTGFTGNAPDYFGDNEDAVFVDNRNVMQHLFQVMKDIRTAPLEKEKINQMEKLIQIKDSPSGVIVSFRTENLFDPGSAAINPARAEILEAAGKLLRRTTNTILIMGHAGSSKPKSIALQSSWELSLYRALEVMYYLTANFTMEPNRFAVGGMGDAKPKAATDTPESGKENDRIEFILMKKKI